MHKERNIKKNKKNPKKAFPRFLAIEFMNIEEITVESMRNFFDKYYFEFKDAYKNPTGEAYYLFDSDINTPIDSGTDTTTCINPSKIYPGDSIERHLSFRKVKKHFLIDAESVPIGKEKDIGVLKDFIPDFNGLRKELRDFFENVVKNGEFSLSFMNEHLMQLFSSFTEAPRFEESEEIINGYGGEKNRLVDTDTNPEDYKDQRADLNRNLRFESLP